MRLIEIIAKAEKTSKKIVLETIVNCYLDLYQRARLKRINVLVLHCIIW